MTEPENIYLQGLTVAVNTLAAEIAKQRLAAQEAEKNRNRYDELPEWIDLTQAVILKRGLRGDDKSLGGAPITFYRQKPLLQPCCGRNYKMVGGRRCWHRDDVIAWLAITDEGLESYAKRYRVTITDIKAGEKSA